MSLQLEQLTELSLDTGQRAYDVVRVLQPEHTNLNELGQDNKGNVYYGKDETDNPTGAYKWRGASVKLNHLMEMGRLEGVVTASAGNHGQGVAWVAGQMGITPEVFVPVGTPESKLNGLHNLGAHVHLLGKNFDEATALAQDFALKQETPFVHPFNDLVVMDGQGTIADELIMQLSERQLDYEDTTVFVPVGGGGLIAGVSRRLKALTNGQIKVVGVQVQGSDSASLTYKDTLDCSVQELPGAQRFHSPNRRPTFVYMGRNSTNPNNDVDGTCVKQVGDQCLTSIFHSVDEFIVVSPELVGKYYFNNEYTKYEPAGVLAEVGASLYGQITGTSLQNLVSIQTGRNQDPQRIENLKESYTKSLNRS